VVDSAPDGRVADALVATERYDAITLDLGLPGVDGLTLLRRWRSAGLTTPVLILTARGSWHERVLGIDGGADDYLAKPFQIEEVLARLRALIRRAAGHARNDLRAGAITLDLSTARATRDGEPVKLTSQEFRVLSYLMHHQARIVTRTELSEHLYARDADRDSNTVEVFIARLRRKFGPASIETLRGIGYRMRTADPAP
jgi:two-component system OmpR family response regulator